MLTKMVHSDNRAQQLRREIISSNLNIIKVIDGGGKNVTMSILQSKMHFVLTEIHILHLCVCSLSQSTLTDYSPFSTKSGKVTKKEQSLKQHLFSFASVALH